MLSFLIRRILQTIPTMLAVVLLIFALFSVVPGSIVSTMSDDSDPQVEPVTVSRRFFGSFDCAQQFGGNPVAAPDDPHPHVVGHASIRLGDEVAAEEAHQQRNFARGPCPVVRRKGVQREHPNPAVWGSFDDFANDARPGNVTRRARTAARIRPASVAVHDDCYVNSTLRQRRVRRSDVRVLHCMVSVGHFVSAPVWLE